VTSPAPFGRPRWLGGKLILALVLGVAVLIGLAAWANALTEPVVRAGVPTRTVTPPPAKPKPTPKPTASPSPSQSGKPSASAKPSGSAKPSAKPSKSAKPSAKPSQPTFTTSSVKQASASGTGKEHTFVVTVQTATGLKANDVATEIAGVLNDPRSWAGKGTVRFSLVKDAKQADFTVYVADPKAADGKCSGEAWVCVRGGKLILSANGWTKGAATYGDDLTGFRRYLVNHAVGLHLGEKKAACKTKGKAAPVMAPQGDDLKGCKPNPWPYS